MATFPIKLGQRNGGNSRVLRGLQSGIFKDAFVGDWVWQVNLVPTSITLEGDTSQAFDLNTIFASNPFPTNVVRKQPLIRVVTPIVGAGPITAAVAILGDTNDDNGLVESQSVFAAGTLQSVAAAEFAPRFEAAFAPLLTIGTTGGNLSGITAMSIFVQIHFSPVASVT
jgi:hypothetical protein